MNRVLIVDDNMVLLQALSDAIAFRIPGTVVDTTWSGHTALAMAQTTDYEAIVVDLKMSGLNGFEVIRRLERIRPKTPTLLVTAHGSREMMIDSLRHAAFMEKPIDRDCFMAWLNGAIQHHRHQKAVSS
jgi:DNA-binding response OmpR family regulator